MQSTLALTKTQIGKLKRNVFWISAIQEYVNKRILKDAPKKNLHAEFVREVYDSLQTTQNLHR